LSFPHGPTFKFVEFLITTMLADCRIFVQCFLKNDKICLANSCHFVDWYLFKASSGPVCKSRNIYIQTLTGYEIVFSPELLKSLDY